MFEFFKIKNVFFTFFFPLSSRWNAPTDSAPIGESVDSKRGSGGWAVCATLWWNEGAKAERAVKLWFQIFFNKVILISISFFWAFANALIVHNKFRAVLCLIKINKKPFVKKNFKKNTQNSQFWNFFYLIFFLCVCGIFSFFFKNFLHLFEYFFMKFRN